MRLLAFIALLPLAAADCPDFLQGIEKNSTYIMRFDEALDTACGRRNYTSIFWSRFFHEQLITHMGNVTDEYMPLKPLFESLQEKFDAMESDDASEADLDAKDFIDSVFERNEKLRAPKDPDAFKENPMGGFIASIFQMMVIPISTIFTPDISIALMHAFKTGFGVEETEGWKQSSIDTAVQAIERVGLESGDEKMGELFGRLYILATTPIAIRRNAFDQFAEWTEKQWNSTEIGPLEILPASEILYMQYQNLKRNESKIFVDWMLFSHAQIDPDFVPLNERNLTKSEIRMIKAGFDMKNRDREMMALYSPGLASFPSSDSIMEKLVEAREKRTSEFANICPSRNAAQCFNELPDEARQEISSTFPELFAYLNQKILLNIDSSLQNNQIEGSGEGSGMF